MSEKFLAYDYAGSTIPGGKRRTQCRRTTAANGDQIMGTPQHQITVAKVTPHPRPALLAALDAHATLHPDAVNMSLRPHGRHGEQRCRHPAPGVYEAAGEGHSRRCCGNEFQAGYGKQVGQELALRL